VYAANCEKLFRESVISGMLCRSKLTAAKEDTVIRKLGLGLAGLMLAAALGIEFMPAKAYAARVDCTKVMAEVNAGKKPKVIAKSLGISTSSVYRCKRKARLAAKKETGMTNSMSAPPAAVPASK
jgi:hypothetical protein